MNEPSRTGHEQFDTSSSPAGFYPWLLVGFGPVAHLIDGDFAPVWVAGLGLGLFAVLYLLVLWLGVQGLGVAARETRPWWLFGALTVLTIALLVGFGDSMYALAPLLSIVWGAVLPWDRRPIAPVAVVVLAAVVAGLAFFTGDASPLDLLWGVSLSGFVTALFLRLMRLIDELRETRRQLAESAVENERLRFSRDLHDLLGHSLSVMVVKAQAVRRVADRPEIVAEQARDIEEIGREALGQTRRAVTGYRGRGLIAELDAARGVLGDSAIEAVIRLSSPPTSPDADYLFGWVIREGVTNVIRHSGATRCEITVTPGAVMVEDDGRGGDSGPGNGLLGLSERAAVLGGELTGGPRTGGGFRLTVTLPE
ncbi:sensor histidine kinase [Nocardia tengchongensis]|uniref:sensor histidine kinase n=1 Tax=Nocardia tengchongensis TaxID=2055889 RepID=UPI003694F88F